MTKNLLVVVSLIAIIFIGSDRGMDGFRPIVEFDLRIRPQRVKLQRANQPSLTIWHFISGGEDYQASLLGKYIHFAF
ncbi:hypothetical protein OWV82_007079 [Melia azedarach]|uniref:Uncharacterized protein n=1 Tax=Melia azedarach TaxID=155640 RepID=A0ACC1YJU2_MELAZ|nr:hypothetical protein OWV82_007079 [Melia azedarach]